MNETRLNNTRARVTLRKDRVQPEPRTRSRIASHELVSQTACLRADR
jgi:hypothetical protein